MSRTRVAILSSQSLFTEGVASRLREHAEQIDLRTVDSRQPDALQQVIAIRPATIILDATDPDIDAQLPLDTVLEALPSLRVIRLDSQHSVVQVVTSEQRSAAEVRDLIQLIGLST